MTKYRQTFLMLLLVSSTALSAQNCRVGGNLYDSKDGTALPYVNCVLLHAADSSFAYGATSGEGGSFVFRQVPRGDYLLRVSFVGYATHWQPVGVSGDLDLGRIGLSKSSTMLGAVTVSAQKPLYAVDGEKQLYNVTEDPSVQTGTVSDVLQNAPGVEVDAEGNITLRGSSSVEIWLNDRPSHMNAEALKQYIKQLPANSVERVEVITNPSARYSTTGAVINIVTNQRVTRNELLCFGLNARTSPSLSPWLSYVWANEKVDLNFYVSGDYTAHRMKGEGTNVLLNDNGDTSRTQDFSTRSKFKNFGGYMGLNINWNIDSMTNLAAWAGAYPYWSTTDERQRYNYFEYLPTLTDHSYDYHHEGSGLAGGGYAGVWLEHRFDSTGRKVSLSANGNVWANRGTADETREYANPAFAGLDRHHKQSNVSPNVGLELNYTHPLRNGIQMEAGAELGVSRESEYTRLDSLNTATGAYSMEQFRSYEGWGCGTRLSGYLTAQKRWGGLALKLGLRAEQAWAKSRYNYLEQTATADVDTAIFGLVPSIHLSYSTPGFSNFSISYTRRHNTPDVDQLSPFVQYDDYSFTTGNPDLSLSHVHNLEAAWSKYIMKFGNVGVNAYFRANTDEVRSLTDVIYSPYHGAWVNYVHPVNVGNSHTEGIEANVTYRPTAMFNLRLNASLFNYYYSTQYRGSEIHDSKVSYSLRLNLWTKVWNRLEIFANARYVSPRIGLYSISNAYKSVDFGCSSDFFDRKLTLMLNVNDIFGWTQWGENSTNPFYTTTGSQSYNSRFVSLGLTFRFGKMELEGKARQGATQSSTGVPGQ